MRQSLILLFLLSINFYVNAQFNVSWAKNIGGTDYDIGYSVEVDSQDNVYVAGMFRGDISFDSNSNDLDFTADSLGDMFLSKYDSEGNFQWVKVFSNENVVVGIDGLHDPVDLKIDDNDNVFMASVFHGEIDLDPGVATDIHVNLDPGENTFIVKLDTDGNYIWGKSFQTSNPSPPFNRAISLSNIEFDSSNNLLITGDFHGIVDFDFDSGATFSMEHDFGRDGFVLKIDTDGNFIWAKQFTGGIGFNIDSVTSDSMDNIILSGGFSGSNFLQTDFDPGPGTYFLNTSGNNDQDIFVLKLSSDGEFIWVKVPQGPTGSLASNSFERIKSIVTDNNDDLIFSGHFTETINFESSSSNFILNDPFCDGSSCNYKAFVGKMDADGNMVWVKKVNGEHSVFTAGNGNAASSFNVLSKNSQGHIYFGLTFNGNLEYELNDVAYNYDNSNVVGWATLDLAFFQIDNSNGDWVNAHVIINNTLTGTVFVNYASLYDIEFIENDLYASGLFYQEVFFDTNTSLVANNSSNSSSPDVFLVKYEGVNLLSNEEYSQSATKVFPNPANSELNIKSSVIINEISVIDINGRVLTIVKDLGLAQDLIIDVENLSNGIYFLKIQSDSNEQVIRFVKN